VSEIARIREASTSYRFATVRSFRKRQITVNGYLAKNGSHLANARSMTLSDGRTLFAGSSAETDPK
jgi:hypothetical protein